MGAVSQGTSRIRGCLRSGDVESTRRALRALGVRIEEEGDILRVEGQGLRGLAPSPAPLEMGNSGTTTRLLLGLLAGHPFQTTLRGDASLSRRPMRRVTEPLMRMGAVIQGAAGADRLPLTIQGGSLRGIRCTFSVPSAQVKSALLLAGLYAEGETTVVEPVPTRDHTERILRHCGADLAVQGIQVTVRPAGPLQGRDLAVPGDISSAAFFLVAAAIVPGSSVTAQGVGLNPTRTAFLDVLSRMGGRLSVAGDGSPEWEPAGDVRVTHSSLSGVEIPPEAVPRLIDELPILMVAATQARGVTRIQGAGELRVKETDRITSMAAGLGAMGARVQVEGDEVRIEGPTPLKGASVDSFGDHRTAMALAVAGLVAQGPTTIERSEWIGISFPGFAGLLEALRR